MNTPIQLHGVTSSLYADVPTTSEFTPATHARSWADWIERDFPFYSAMVYAQRGEPSILADNLTPRGLVLNLGAALWACFDLDLLRISAVWEGEEVKTHSNAAISYYGEWPSYRERKPRLPLAEGAVWLANGLYPGWQTGTEPALRDPREPGPPPLEIGRGPLAESEGRFRAVRLTQDGVRLDYSVADAFVQERISRITNPAENGIERRIGITATQQPLVLILAAKLPWSANGSGRDFVPGVAGRDAHAIELLDHDEVWAVRVRPHAEPIEFCVRLTRPAARGDVRADGAEPLFVFDRNGIWRLHDTNGDGEADVHELFTNAFGQTLTVNEYSNTMKLAPDGSFIIAKKGLQDSAHGKLYGSVSRISPDGRTSTLLGWGFRQPFIGVDPLTGTITASDQEGNYVPATPLYLVRDATYHGFLASPAEREKYPAPIDDPLTWMPRTGSASGVTQVWLRNARMGLLNDALIYVSYNRPELFVVRLNERHEKLQAAVISLTRKFDFSLIGATVNPADGQLYVAGFKIYGSGAKRTSGLARVRHTGGPCVLPREVVPATDGVLLRFDVELAPKQVADLASYSVERWNYQRTAAYGSPHYKLDGSKGQDRMWPSSVYHSTDRKAVFIGIPDMRAGVMQMQVGWQLATSDGMAFENVAHFTPFALTRFSPSLEGFDEISVDLTPRAHIATPQPTFAASVDEGERLYQATGCMACHTTSGAAQLGPTWRGLYGSRRELVDGSTAIADESYLRESILEPTAKVVPGFETPMPSYAGILSEQQIESLVMYIKTLQ